MLAVDVVYLLQRETAILQCSLVDDAPMLDMRAIRFYAISVTVMTVSAQGNHELYSLAFIVAGLELRVWLKVSVYISSSAT